MSIPASAARVILLRFAVHQIADNLLIDGGERVNTVARPVLEDLECPVSATE